MTAVAESAMVVDAVVLAVASELTGGSGLGGSCAIRDGGTDGRSDGRTNCRADGLWDGRQN